MENYFYYSGKKTAVLLYNKELGRAFVSLA
jgi:hypothetical protein